MFEGIRCYATDMGPGSLSAARAHRRLVTSALVLGIRSLPYTAEQIADAIRLTVAANGFDECYIRPLVYLTDGGWNLTVDSGKAGWGLRSGSGTITWAKKRSIKACAPTSAPSPATIPNVMLTKAKITGNYVNSVLAKTESMRLGFDEAILLDPQGYVAECTGENIFVVRNGKIYTPPTMAILEGITRDSLIKLAGDQGYTVVEQPISRDQLYLADEVFVSGTAAECIGLREIDFRIIGNGKTGPVTHALQRLYDEVVHGRHPRSVEWLDYVHASYPLKLPSKVTSSS